VADGVLAVDRREGIVRAAARPMEAATVVGNGAEIAGTVAGVAIAGASKVRRRSSWIS
jgi:hypothetical protein